MSWRYGACCHSMKHSIVNAALYILMLSVSFQTAFAEERSIPKTTEPLLIEAKKKPHHEWVPRETYTIDQLSGYEETPDPEYSRYGGMADTQFPATGFFYTRKFNDRWWLVDPEGHLWQTVLETTGQGRAKTPE